MTQFDEGKGYEVIRMIKVFYLKIQEATSKRSFAINEKKESNMSEKSHIPTRDIYLQKMPRFLISQMNQSLGMMFQLYKMLL